MNRLMTFTGTLILAVLVTGCSDGGSQPKTGTASKAPRSAAPAAAIPHGTDSEQQATAGKAAERTADPASSNPDALDGGTVEPKAEAATSAREPSEPSALRSLGRALLKGFTDSP